jgi:hypothetical protein
VPVRGESGVGAKAGGVLPVAGYARVQVTKTMYT